MATLTADQMVSPKAVAPFEAALAFQLWQEKFIAEAHAQGVPADGDEAEGAMIITAEICDRLGPPFPLLSERPAEWGERAAAALFTLLKEI